MAYVRHASRHLQRTMTDHLTTWLDSLGWTGSDPPFGTVPVTVQARRMRESELVPITGNMVAISFGEEPDDEPVELGAGLLLSRTEMYVDVVAVSDPIGLALASDVKDLLTGRAPGTNRFLMLADYTSVATGVATADHRIEVTTVQRSRPEISEIKAFWQVVVAELEMTFPGTE